MPRPRYVVHCTMEGCQEVAAYKIAAEWSDGTLHELKTYGLACQKHLHFLFKRGRDKQETCHLVEGETLSRPGIFRIEPGRRDRELVRMVELETRLG